MKLTNRFLMSTLVILIVLFNLVLFGCLSNKEQVDDNEEVIDYTMYNDIQKVHYSEDAKDVLLVVNSIEELNALKSNFGFVIVDENEWQRFDGNFFAGNSLIVINVVKNYTGPDYELNKIKRDGKTALILIKESNKSADVNDEMSCLFYVISVNKDSVESIENYEIVYIRR